MRIWCTITRMTSCDKKIHICVIKSSDNYNWSWRLIPLYIVCVSGSLVLYYTHANRVLQPRPFTPSTTLDMCISKYTVSQLRQNQAPSRHHALTEWYITVPISQIDLNFNIAFEGVRVIGMFYQFCSVFGYLSFLDDSHSLACQMLGLCTHFYPGIVGGVLPWNVVGG